MPHFNEHTLWAGHHLVLRRVACDGVDSPRPTEEFVDGDRVIVILQGCFCLHDRNGPGVASPQFAVCLPDGHTYYVRHAHACGDVCLTLRGDVASRICERGPVLRPVTPGAYLELQALAADLAAGSAATQLMLEERLCGAFSASEHVTRGRGRDGAIADALRYRLEADFSASLSLNDLATSAGISMFHMCRAFKRAVGTTIHQYQQEIRLRHALALLLETRLPLAQIALDVGFANQGHFANAFHRRFQATPSRVRLSRGTVLPR
jgi:AraC family transcriptional regulator